MTRAPLRLPFSIRWKQALAPTIVALACAFALAGCGRSYRYVVSYRLSLTVTVNGGDKTDSSIVRVVYYGSDRPDPSGATGFVATRGVAPVIALRPYGWLVAALQPDGDEYFRRGKSRGFRCKEPVDASSLPSVFGPGLKALTDPQPGVHTLPDDRYPAFIFFPAGRPYTDARQICPSEFGTAIAPGTALKSVTVEYAPDARVPSYLQINAPWLDEMRKDQVKYYEKSGDELNRFKAQLRAQIETQNVYKE